MSLKLHLSAREIDFQAGSIFQIAARNESGVVVCYPGAKIDYNLTCYLDSTSIRRKWLGQYHKRFLFVQVPLAESTTTAELLETVRIAVASIGIDVTACQTLGELARVAVAAGRELYILLVETQPPSPERLRDIVGFVHRELMASNRVGAILFTEADVHDSVRANVLADNYKLLQNVIYFPVYSYQESVYFLHQLASDFGLMLTDELAHELATVCGGFLWLLRGTLRKILDSPGQQVTISEIFDSPLVQLRVKSIVAHLSKKQRQVLEHIVANEADQASRTDLQYLLATGVVRQSVTEYGLASELMADQIRAEMDSVPITMGQNQELMFENQAIGALLTQREKQVMALLIAKRGMVVQREEIAQEMWGNEWEEAYSDWAIDKMMSRLRKALTEEGLPKNTIRTKKGLGFVMR